VKIQPGGITRNLWTRQSDRILPIPKPRNIPSSIYAPDLYALKVPLSFSGNVKVEGRNVLVVSKRDSLTDSLTGAGCHGEFIPKIDEGYYKHMELDKFDVVFIDSEVFPSGHQLDDFRKTLKPDTPLIAIVDNKIDGIDIVFRGAFFYITRERLSAREIDFVFSKLIQLKDRGFRDPLTKIFNRGFFDERLEIEINRARRENYNIAFLMIDIDHFKEVNDTYGHEAGDKILREVAIRIEASMRSRSTDVVARYGGEEIVAILPRVESIEKAKELAARVNHTVSSNPIIYDPLNSKSVVVTVSIGISFGEPFEELVSQADSALYDVKEHGRNGYGLFGDS
jgi:diguanylate cyclase (GGDEF)-like protein